jgi:hypothetical protein
MKHMVSGTHREVHPVTDNNGSKKPLRNLHQVFHQVHLHGFFYRLQTSVDAVVFHHRLKGIKLSNTIFFVTSVQILTVLKLVLTVVID